MHKFGGKTRRCACCMWQLTKEGRPSYSNPYKANLGTMSLHVLIQPKRKSLRYWKHPSKSTIHLCKYLPSPRPTPVGRRYRVSTEIKFPLVPSYTTTGPQNGVIHQELRRVRQLPSILIALHRGPSKSQVELNSLPDSVFVDPSSA